MSVSNHLWHFFETINYEVVQSESLCVFRIKYTLTETTLRCSTCPKGSSSLSSVNVKWFSPSVYVLWALKWAHEMSCALQLDPNELLTRKCWQVDGLQAVGQYTLCYSCIFIVHLGSKWVCYVPVWAFNIVVRSVVENDSLTLMVSLCWRWWCVFSLSGP